jgi:protein-tyrosine-phosphatase
MAAALLSQAATRSAGSTDLSVDSAGTSASRGSPATREAIEVMAAHGADLSDHRAKPLTRELVEAADLVLTMTEDHLDTVARRYPEHLHKVVTLGTFAGTRKEVGDPMDQGRHAYESCADQLKSMVSAVVDRLSRDLP